MSDLKLSSNHRNKIEEAYAALLTAKITLENFRTDSPIDLPYSLKRVTIAFDTLEELLLEDNNDPS